LKFGSALRQSQGYFLPFGYAFSFINLYSMHITLFLLLILAGSTKGTGSEHDEPSPEGISLTFNLHQEYCVLEGFRFPSRVQIDAAQGEPTWTLQSRPTTVYRPSSPAGLQRARLRSMHQSESEKVEWITTKTLGPDIEDRHTLAQLARMTGNAYALPGEDNWYDIDPSWNNVCIIPILTIPSDD
jgi:hypothetical protein